MIVLDASAAVELLLGTALGQRVARRIRLLEVSVHVPHLLDLEIAQTLRRYVRTERLPPARGKLALEHLLQLDFVRHRKKKATKNPVLLGKHTVSRGPKDGSVAIDGDRGAKMVIVMGGGEGQNVASTGRTRPVLAHLFHSEVKSSAPAATDP
ncbi:MAG: type II toxin-antitoxin system VapC family toxin, partial [Acidobacteriota bacterium]